MTQLVKWEKARQAIAEAKSIDEVKQIRDKAQAFLAYVKQQKESLIAQNDVAEIKLRCERRIGKMLKENIPHEGGRPKKQSQDATVITPKPIEQAQVTTLQHFGITKSSSSRWQAIAELPEDKFEKYVADVKASNEELTTVGMIRMAKGLKVYVGFNSGGNEWYTPPEYIEAARKAMGSIDTDPASSEFANKYIKAKKYFTKENDGLKKKWEGNVWLNPPYSQPLIDEFSNAVSSKFKNQEVSQACILVNNATETNWFQRMLGTASCVCFVKGRIRFLNIAGNPTSTPLQGQTILYFGNNSDGFKKHFDKFGFILWSKEVKIL